MKKFSVSMILLSLLFGCGSSSYKFWDISHFNITPNALHDNEEIKLLYSSRGPGNNEKLSYYIHLVIISQETGDTINVLTTADNGFSKEDGNEVYNFFDENNVATKIIQLDVEDLKDIDKFDEIELKKIDKVARDPEFDFIADNSYPTVIGSIGNFEPTEEE